MSTHDNRRSDCLKDADLAALLYDEMSDTERFPLEEHLADCSNCIDEFAAISEARLSAYEWNRDEFAHLATPAVRIPYSDSTERAGFFEKVFSGLSVFTQFGNAVVAFGAIFAVVGFGGYYLLRLSAETNVAETRSEPVVESVVTSKRSENTVSETRTTDTVSPATLEKPRTGGVRADVIKVRRTQAAKAEDVAAKKQIHKIESGSLVAQQQSSPRLTNSAEVSDNSLRLADLFSELDANE